MSRSDLVLKGPRYDTRGLPEGYDPRNLYEYRIKRLSKDASGLEGLIYKWIPLTVIRSFAFAIDPTAQFKVSPGVITPVNRTKYRATNSVFNQRSVFRGYTHVAYASTHNYYGVGCLGPTQYGTPDTGGYTQQLPSQEVLTQTLKDTTKRTRLMGSKQGELEKFSFTVNSPTRETHRLDNSDTYIVPTFVDPLCVAGVFPDVRGDHYDSYDRYTGPAATLPVHVVDNLKLKERNLAEALMAKQAISLIKDLSFGKRDYTLFRNLVELRDLPRSITSLRDVALDLRRVYASLSHNPSLRDVIFDLKGLASKVPGEYLSFHFGWKQLYKDVTDLLAQPKRLSKKLNFLISKSGKPTTLRLSRKFVSGESDVSGFDYEWSRWDFDPRHIQSRIERESELRLVINTTFDFAPVNNAQFKDQKFYELLGIEPRITDFYNLVPWTWLFDWFTGFGGYVECIDNINHDPNFINWGMLTCETTGKLITDLRSTYMTRRSYSTNTGGNLDVETLTQGSHSSVMEYSFQMRKDVSNVLDVNMATDPGSLTPYQLSIIGALLTQRTSFSRPSPRGDSGGE